MKKILQAFDSASTGEKKAVVGVNDMKRFLSVVTEGAKVDRMVSHIKASEKEAGKSDKDAENIAWATVNKRGYLDNKNKKNEDSLGSDANDFLLAADRIQDEVMGQVDKIKINADEALLRDMMDKFNAFMTSYHAVGKEILQPDLLDDVSESTDFEIRRKGKTPAELGGADAWYHRGQIPHYYGFEKGTPEYVEYMKAFAEWDEGPSGGKQYEGLSIKDYFNLAEAKKDPCWKDYQQVGMKEKNGKKVPNCVPKKGK